MCRRKFFNVPKCADRLIVQQRNTRNNQTLFVCFVFYYTQDTGIVGTWKMAVGCQSSSWRNSIHASHPTIRVSWRVCVTSMAIVTRVCDRYNGSARTAMKRAAKAARLKKRGWQCFFGQQSQSGNARQRQIGGRASSAVPLSRAN